VSSWPAMARSTCTPSKDPSASARAAAQAATLISAIRHNIERALRGKPEIVRRAVETLLAGGHLLLEDVPGVGKTTLAQALARSIDGSFSRIQFTSDLLPSDVLGASVPELRNGAPTGGFRFQPGPIFANVVLADEVNRASPKTQSALLEAMAESGVTVDGVSANLDAKKEITFDNATTSSKAVAVQFLGERVNGAEQTVKVRSRQTTKVKCEPR